MWRGSANARAYEKSQELDDDQRKQLPALLARADAAIVERTHAWQSLATRESLSKHEPGSGGCANAPTGPSFGAA